MNNLLCVTTLHRAGGASRLLILLAALFVLMSEPGAAQEATRPLLIEGKDRLFQRVLIRERTGSYDAPDGTATEATIRPLQSFFVYQRDGEWLRIGSGDQGKDLFWVPAKNAIDWRQNIVAVFETSANLDRLLFFRDIDDVYDVIESEAPEVDAARLREEAMAAERGDGESEVVVALGPEHAIDQRQNLYVMPILNAEEAILDRSFVNLLNVAVARADTGARVTLEPSVNAPERTRENYKAAVVFVVDTTISMEPYIRGTQAALTEVYEHVRRAAAQDTISFGLIGYRDNLAGAPDLGYSARTFVRLSEGFKENEFLSGIAQMTEADQTSRDFREDSYAGIEHALNDMDWSDFGARYIVLVTDAGPREAGDDLSATGLSAEGLNRLAREQTGAAIAVMHLRTSKGASNHDEAEAAYRELTRQPNLPPLYFPVENGSPDIYRDSARKIGQLVVDEVQSFREGQEPRDFADQDPDGLTEADAFRSAGRAMQLAYLGRETGAQAPDVFEAYVADRDFERVGLKPLSIRLMLTKSELSNLDEALKIIIQKAEENVINPNEFFSQVLSAAADMSRRPDEVSRNADPSLAEASFIAEYIEDLPYKSRIMSITEDEWVRMSISDQQTLVNELYEKIERYNRYNSATDQWVDYLGTGAEASGLVYPMSLDDLP
jgi:serine/threonine-protein kinase PpkA